MHIICLPFRVFTSMTTEDAGGQAAAASMSGRQFKTTLRAEIMMQEIVLLM